MFRSQFVKDLLERVLATYVEVFLGLVIVSAFSDGVVDMSAVQAAAISALPAALAVIKGWVGRYRGDPDSASLSKDISA